VKHWLVAMMIAVPLNAAPVPNPGPPATTIASSDLKVQVYLPDLKNGYYRGTRFDWSGVVSSLQYKNHSFFGPWFQRWDPAVHDFIYDGNDIVAGTCSAISGPVEEFGPVGYEEAKPNQTFLKIGVGALRKADDTKYDNYRTYEIANPGTWTIEKGADRISFIQKLEGADGYGYLYTKTFRLVAGRPRMIIEHHLKNIGQLAIKTTVYDHNFLVMDRRGPQAGTTLSFPFAVDGGSKPLLPELAEIKGHQITYNKTLEGKDVVASPVQGFSNNAKDYDVRVESRATGTGVKITGDQPMMRMGLWSIRSVLSIEPFIEISIKPGQEMTWNLTYDFYLLPASQ
jgi:hypothetical protein